MFVAIPLGNDVEIKKILLNLALLIIYLNYCSPKGYILFLAKTICYFIKHNSAEEHDIQSKNVKAIMSVK